MAHFQNFQSVATASLGERVPKVAGAWYFGLPFVMDSTVTWADWFAGVEPRSFLVGLRPEGHAEAGRVYPLDVATIKAGLADDATDDQKASAEAEAARFIGFAIEGTDYEHDANMTVALAGGIKEEYLQQDHSKDAYVLDPDVAEILDAEMIPVNRIKRHLFWNTIQ